MPPQTELIRLNAVDADSGQNAQIQYSLRTSIVFRDIFEIDPQNGVLKLSKSLPNNEPDLIYQVEVDATDQGMPSLSSSTSVRFTTANINPHSPEFEKVFF